MHQLFDEIIGTPPPTSVDPHALVRRDRRARAARWTGVGATGALVVVVSAAMAFSSATTPAGTPPVGAPPATAPSPVPDTRFELRSATREEAQVSAGRLATALNDAVRTAVPAAIWTQGSGVEITVIDYVSPPGWHGAGTLRVGDLRGGITVMAHTLAEGGWTPATLSCATFPKPAGDQKMRKPETPRPCVDRTTPSGTPVLLHPSQQTAPQVFELRIGLPANRIMTITVTGSEGGGPTVLSVEQALLVAQHAAERIR